MGFLVDLFKPQPTKAEIERQQKKKLAKEVSNLDDIKRSLQLVKNVPYKSVRKGPAQERVYIVSEENQRKHDSLLDQLIKKADSMVYVHYNTDRIFSLTEDLIEILKEAKKRGTNETIDRCIMGLNYALSEGLSPVPVNKNEEDVKKQREDILSAYYQICSLTLNQDELKNKIEIKEKEKEYKEQEYKDAIEDMHSFAAAHHGAYNKVKVLTPDQRTKLTGIEKQIAAKMQTAINRSIELTHIQQKIGQINLDLAHVEHSCKNLFNIVNDLKISVNEDDVEEIKRLTKEWENTVRKEQESIGKLREAANEMNIAFDTIYNDRSTKETIIAINDEYEKMLYERTVQEAEDKAGAQLYWAELEKKKQDIEASVYNEMAANVLQENEEELVEENEADESMLLL